MGENSRLHLRSVTRHLAACLLMICVVAAAAAQPSVAPPPSAPAALPVPAPVEAPAALPALAGGAIQAIQVVGNQRIEAGTIRSYLVVRPGDPFDPDRLDRSVKTLFSTGLFKNVQLSRQGNVLIVNVEENPLVNKVAIEGNHRLSDDQIKPEIQTKPRAVYTPAMVEADRQKSLIFTARRAISTPPSPHKSFDRIRTGSTWCFRSPRVPPR
jgi:outer membrane protein insertion porin family